MIMINNKAKVRFISTLTILSLISVLIIAAIPVSACYYTVGTFEEDYTTEKESFFKGEIVYGKGTADVYRLLKLRIKDPDGNIVYYSEESYYTVYGSFFLNDTASIGTWKIQLGVYTSCWKWPKTSEFTVDDANFTLTVNVNGSGSVIKDPDQEDYSYGSEVDLTAVPEDGWSFSHWEDDLSGSGNPESIFMDSNKTVTANFTQNQYILNVSVVGNGTVNIDPDLPFYTHGSIVDLTANPNSTWVFDHWEEDLDSEENLVSITMDSDKNITAVFTQSLYTLTINIDEEGSGFVEVDPPGPYNHGDEVNLTAIPYDGNSFSHWSGDLSGSDDNVTIVMDSDKTVTANFTQNRYNLTINIEGNGQVTKNPDQQNYSYGTIVEVTAIPDSEWVFDHWSGNLSGTDSSEEVNMTEDKNITAHFKEQEEEIKGGRNGDDKPSRKGPKINIPPVAIAGGPYTAFINETIEFNGSKSYDADNDIISYKWDFGDRTYGEGEIVTHSYSVPGEYEVVLTVEDTEKASDDNVTMAIIIQPNRPPSEPNISGPTKGITNNEYAFSIVASDEDNDNIRFTVEWGDGSSNISDFLPSGEYYNVSHKWNETGEFTIKVTADDNQTITTGELTITIEDPVEPEIPEAHNICLVLLLILILLFSLLLIYLLEKPKKKKDENTEK